MRVIEPVTLDNRSPVRIEISKIEILNDATDFSADQMCIGLLQVPCPVSVTFTPRSAGKKRAKLRIWDAAAGSPHSVSLLGTGF